METPPGKVIRSLRQALHMTQAEFARAAGWSISTISSWERGTSQPSRLAFKTILAFAEERGVRYQPTGEGAASPSGATPGLPTLRLGSRLPGPPLVARDTGREESFGSRRWTEVAKGPGELSAYARAVPERTAAFDARLAAFESARPDWSLDARLRLELGAGTRWLRRVAAFGAVLVAVAIGAGAGVMLRSGASTSSAPRAAAAVARAAAPAPPAPVDELALAAVAAPALGPAPYAAPLPGEMPGSSPPAVRSMPPPMHARLESIVALDGTHRATFRVGDRSITLVEGDQLGGRSVALIADDEVTLVGGGVATRVQLGLDTALE